MSAALRVRVTDLGRRGVKNPAREYDVSPDGAIKTEMEAVTRYASDCGIPPYKRGSRYSVYFSRFQVQRVQP